MAHRGSWRRSAELRASDSTGGDADDGEWNGGSKVRRNGAEVQRKGISTSDGGSNAGGPAAPLVPLQISPTTVIFPARPLPHPSTYAGSDNWAFTPSDTMPSLPATPLRGTRDQMYTAASWSAQRGAQSGAIDAAVPNGQPVRPTSRDGGQFGMQPLSARSVFNRRLEEHRTQSPSPVRNSRPSPRMSYAGLMGTVNASPLSATMRSMSASDASSSHMHAPVPNAQLPAASISAVLTQAANSSDSSPALRHRESFTSAASSNAAGLGQHPLMHSRRPSQIFVQSPTSPTSHTTSSGANNIRASPAYRVYRPPHMRTDSYFALQPRMAHYDRVTAPTMRGQSRSPSMSLSNSGSSAVSRTTSERPSLSSEQAGRRLSMLGVHNTLIHNATSTAMTESEQQNTALDSRSLIAKLAKARLNLLQHTAQGSPQGSDRTGLTSGHAVVEDDEFDLTAEDMMMMSGTLTDEYCRSRSSSMSISEADNSVDIFDIGDRIGPGMTHDGHVITIAETTEGFHDQNADWSGTQLEVMSKLGEGSYATVYLVKEVARRGSDAFTDGADETVRKEPDADQLSSTLKASASGRLAEEQSNHTLIGRDQMQRSGDRYFALKCLCKRDLSDDMLEVQRLEATIHQSIPPHSNIVTLYRTYETPEWLFLVLEYCPGQDLFYWLEQAQDTENLGAVTPGDNESNGSSADIHEVDSTPPSPGLLASTEIKHLLSRRRLRLISRMFLQMCEAVEFCHSRGIAHRDIKPENFIVEDTRASSLEQAAKGAFTATQSIDGVKVKLTDFGLAVAQTHCIDFDCGSKPYMSYECRNNTAKSYNPIQSDIWSLGIVLLNLIFHRNPFSEPNPERCPSFASYIEDPVFFLTTAFRGLKEDAAAFLAANVFCDVTEDENGHVRQRISARKLGEWASNLSEHLYVKGGGGGNLRLLQSTAQFGEPGADLGITSPLWHSRSPTSSHVNSLLASPASNARSISIQREFTQMGITDEEMENFTPLFADGALSSTVTDRPRPPSTPFRASMGATTTDEGLKQIDEEKTVSDPTQNDTVGTSDVFNDGQLAEIQDEGVEESSVEASRQKDDRDGSNDAMENDDASNADDDTDKNSIPPSTTSTTAKRRKRGARKGRTLAKQQMKRSRSVENLQASTNGEHGETSNETERDRVIRELADASQSLAREMSKAMHGKDGVVKNASVAVGNIPQKPTAAALMSSSSSSVGTTSSAAVRPARPMHASSLVADWRERNGSHASLASVTSFDTLNSFSSEVASIRSTASAPPALLLGRGAVSSFGGLTTVSTTSSRHSGLSVLRTSANVGRPPTGSAPLHTINERAGPSSQSIASAAQQKDLDASYLAEIFGGRPSGRSSRAQPTEMPSSSSTSSKNKQGGGVPVTANTQKPRHPLGVEGGVLDSQSVVKAASTAMSEPSASQSVLEAPRKKMLGKFLQGVKSYNKGVKAAPAMSASTVADTTGDHRSNGKRENNPHDIQL